MYLVAVLDLYARYGVSWALDDTLEQSFVLDAVNRALIVATPQIWNSDQGSHFTSPQDTGLLDAAGVQIVWMVEAGYGTTALLSGSGAA